MPGTTMESPLKRRRISLTRSFDISPIKVATTAPPPRGTATRSVTRSATRSVSKAAGQGNGVAKRTSTSSRRSSDRGRVGNIPVSNDDSAAPNSPITDTIVIQTRASPVAASDPEQSSTTAALAAAALSNAARMNGSGPVDEDIYDTRHIGRGRPGSSLRSSARASPRPLGTAKASQQNRGAALSASPARSTSTANDGGRAASNDGASDPAIATNGKRRGAAGGAVSMASADQENLQGDNQQEQHMGTDEEEEEEQEGGSRAGAEAEAEDNSAFSIPPAASGGSEVVADRQEEDGIVDAPEPELPTLPAQLGLEELPIPPQGLLSSSPSGRKLRRMNKPHATRGRSPNLSGPFTNAARERESTSNAFAARTGAADSVDLASAAVTATALPTTGQGQSRPENIAGQPGRGSEQLSTASEDAQEEPSIPVEPSGPIVTWDLAVERKQDEYEELARQRTRLEAEVRLLQSAVPGFEESEVERRGGRPDDHALLQLLLSSHPNEQVSNGRNKPGSAEKRRDMSSKHASTLIAAFLPFTIIKERNDANDRSTTEQKTHSSTSTPLHPSSSSKLSRELVSYFTPLAISSSGPRTRASTISYSSSSQQEISSLQQEQSFTLTSPDKQLRIELELVTAPVTGKLVSLVVSSMSAWAEPELRNQFCRDIVTPSSSTITSNMNDNSSSSSSSSSSGNIVALATGMARYWELTKVRASTWQRVMAQHASLVIADESVSSSRARQREQTTVSRVAHSEATSQQHALGRRHLHLGRDDIHLHLFWDIRLDPRTGEASSELDANIDCPVGNRDQQRRGRDKGAESPLDGIGELFHLLVRRGGVSRAVKGIVGVVFGDAGGEDDGSGEEDADDAEEGEDNSDSTSGEEEEEVEEERSSDAATESQKTRKADAAGRGRSGSEQTRQAKRAKETSTTTTTTTTANNNGNHDDNDNENDDESSSMDTSED